MSPSVEAVIDGLRLTLQEGNLLADLLQPSEIDVAELAEAADSAGDHQEQHIRRNPAFWLDGRDRKYLSLTSVATMQVKDANYISRLFPLRTENCESDKAEQEMVYPYLLIPVTPPSDGEDGMFDQYIKADPESSPVVADLKP